MKTAKNYLLSDNTLKQIEWIMARAPNATATDVIEYVVREKYESERGEIRLKAIKTKGDKYNLVADNTILASINQAVLDATKDYKQQLLAPEGANMDVIGMVFLATAIAKNVYVKWNQSPKSLALIQPDGGCKIDCVNGR